MTLSSMFADMTLEDAAAESKSPPAVIDSTHVDFQSYVEVSGDASGASQQQACEAFAEVAAFREFHLRPELSRVVREFGFESPSRVQRKCLPEAMAGSNIICQARGGQGKTTIYILATLHQLATQSDGRRSDDQPFDSGIDTLVVCPMRELAYSVARQFESFSKYMPGARVCCHRHFELYCTNEPILTVDSISRIPLRKRTSWHPATTFAT